MIDFRYHLVSLVSVFLALAVGIVLGAGPLKEPLASSLTREVKALAQQKDTLHAELNTAEAGLNHRDDFTTAITPQFVAGRLAGRSVAIVSLPGVDGDVVTPLVNAISAAGGQVTGRITVGGAWIDPARADDRNKVLSELDNDRALPAGTVPASGAPDARLSAVLAGALLQAGTQTVGRVTAAGTTVLEALRSAGLIGIKGKITGLAGAALLLAPANPEAAGKVQPTPAGTPQSEYVTLATVLDNVGGAVVVTGPASSATGGGLLAAIRDDDTAKDLVSTVDTGSIPMGVITAVLALREQLSGGSGAYGFGSGASALMPTPSPTPTASPSATGK